jgi:hypothetical protein
VPQLQLELGDEVGERLVVAVQALEDDGGATAEELERLGRIDEAAELLAGDGRVPGEALLGQDRAVLGDAQGGGTQRRAGQQPVGVLE